MERGPIWTALDAQPRYPVSTLRRADLPESPGVYAWYRGGDAMYSGRATGRGGIRDRVWNSHLKTGPDLSRSSFRRNVCEHLGIGKSALTRQRPAVLSAAAVEPLNLWIRSCDVTWLVCLTADSARELEKNLHAEWLPPLSKR